MVENASSHIINCFNNNFESFSVLDTSACLCNMHWVNAKCGVAFLLKALKPNLLPIMEGAPFVHTEETMLHERSLLVKNSSKNFFTSVTFADVAREGFAEQNSSLKAVVFKLFKQVAVCRYFWASSGQSQRLSLIVLPIKMFSKKKGLHSISSQNHSDL